jgi:hypothetical protein
MINSKDFFWILYRGEFHKSTNFPTWTSGAGNKRTIVDMKNEIFRITNVQPRDQLLFFDGKQFKADANSNVAAVLVGFKRGSTIEVRVSSIRAIKLSLGILFLILAFYASLRIIRAHKKV